MSHMDTMRDVLHLLINKDMWVDMLKILVPLVLVFLFWLWLQVRKEKRAKK